MRILVSRYRKTSHWPAATIAAAILLLVSLPLGAMEVEAEFGGGNLDPEWGRTVSGSSLFIDSYTLLGSAAFSMPVGPQLDLEFGYQYHPILRQNGYAMFGYDGETVKLGVGPFVGIVPQSDVFKLVQPGYLAVLTADWPGIAFIEFETSSPLSSDLSVPGQFVQEHSRIAAGFYSPNARVSLLTLSERFAINQNNTQNDTRLREYALQADLFAKRVPYSLRIRMALQLRDVYSGDDRDSMGSLIFGTQVTVLASRDWTLYFGGDASIYDFGLDGLLGVTSDTLLGFEAFVGYRMSITLPATDPTW